MKKVILIRWHRCLRNIAAILFLFFLFSCNAPAFVDYYRVSIKTEAGQVIYDETGPEYHVNISRGILGNGTIRAVVYEWKNFYSDMETKFSVSGNNLIVTHEFVRRDKR